MPSKSLIDHAFNSKLPSKSLLGYALNSTMPFFLLASLCCFGLCFADFAGNVRLRFLYLFLSVAKQADVVDIYYIGFMAFVPFLSVVLKP